MNNHNIVLDEFLPETPSSEGQYLWKSTLDIELSTIYWVPPKDEYGMSWDGYLAVSGQRGRSVGHLGGSFLKVNFVSGVNYEIK